jgi:hypothetical protein
MRQLLQNTGEEAPCRASNQPMSFKIASRINSGKRGHASMTRANLGSIASLCEPVLDPAAPHFAARI